MKVIKAIENQGHEQLLFCQDSEIGLKAIIAIHNTVLGPSLGGTRMWNYESEEKALKDVLRLSRGMTLKASIAGLDLGGGKAVIIGDPKKVKNEKVMRRFGQFVDSLGGKYITAEDVNMSEREMEWISKETKHVTGLSEELGGKGDPSPITAYTTYLGMKAATKHAFGDDSLTDKKIVVQGIGNVSRRLIALLKKEKASIYVTDIDEEKVNQLTSKYSSVKVCDPEKIFSVDADIYAPCALGGTVNPQSIQEMNMKIIAGCANNQLEDEERDGEACKKKGIVFAPDFLINSGGLINVYAEYKDFSRREVMMRAEKVYNNTLEILAKADRKDQHPQQVAIAEAKKRIEEAKKLRLN